MKSPRSLRAARVFSVLALLSTFALPWFGLRALIVTTLLLLVGTAITPRPVSHAHKPRMRSALDSVKRHLVRHPWRPKGF